MSVFGRVSSYLFFEFVWEGAGWGGGRLSTFSAFRMGAYSRWVLIRGWALIRINPDRVLRSVALLITLHQFAPTGWFLANGYFSSCSFWICQPIPYFTFHKFSFSGQRHHFSCLLNNASVRQTQDCDDHPSFNSSLQSSHIWFSYIHNFRHKTVNQKGHKKIHQVASTI